MNFDDLRRQAEVVREIPLETVLLIRGAVRDQHDRSKWHTEQGPLSITGPKFINWHRGTGGGGAIDLVMHLADIDFRAAVAWLNLAVGHAAVGGTALSSNDGKRETDKLRLPVANGRMLGRVLHYLTGPRGLPTSVLEPLVLCGKLYADRRGNAVFLLVAGKANRPVGAELRGTGDRVWRGMAPGSRKDLGYFWIGAKGARKIVLCESAIDSISCLQIHPDCICISTSGVRANPCWLDGLIARDYKVYCGFDADSSGDAMAREMIALYPAIKRLRPQVHDWNDVLASGC